MSWLQPFRDAAGAHERVVAAYAQAGERRYREAVKAAAAVVSDWADPETVWQRLARFWSLRRDLRQLDGDLPQWQETIRKADAHAAVARQRLQAAGDDPDAVSLAEESAKAWDAAQRLLVDPAWTQEVAKAKLALDQRLSYRQQYAKGCNAADSLWFARSVAFLRQAVELFPNSPATERLAAAESRLADEAAFEAELADVDGLVRRQLLKPALKRLRAALADFPRQDGTGREAPLLASAKAQALYDQGLQAEASGDWSLAARSYAAVRKLDPAMAGLDLRQAAAAAGCGDWATVVQATETASSPGERYLRGHALAHTGRYREAGRSWQGLPLAMDSERETLKALVGWQRHHSILTIAEAITRGDMAAADAACASHVEAFGPDEWVEQTWRAHVQPRRQREDWSAGEWSQLVRSLAASWKQEPKLETLHNWAVAAYFDSERDPEALAVLVDVWPTALANAESDPALRDIPWLAGGAHDAAALQTYGMRILDERVMALKDVDPDRYRQLQIRLAGDRQAMRLLEGLSGIRPVQGTTLVLPGLLRQVPSLASRLAGLPTGAVAVEAKLLAALYTPWGMAVAVCLEGHAAEARALLPAGQPETAVERFAEAFVTHQRALALLQVQEWSTAFGLLGGLGPFLGEQSDWLRQLDQACETLSEQLPPPGRRDFATAWHGTLRTSAAARMHVTHEVRRIQQELGEEKLTPVAAKSRLEALRSLDAKHPVLQETLSLIHKALESERIVKLIQSQGIEAAVRQIRLGGDRVAKQIMADFCARIAVEGLENRTLPPHEARLLVSWAHDLAPGAPEWQELYRICRL